MKRKKGGLKAHKKKDPSKRSQTKHVRTKVARLERRKALLAPAPPPQDTFSSASLSDALAAVAAAPAKKQQLPSARTNKGKRWIAVQETHRLAAVMQNKDFQNDPLKAVTAHLEATLPKVSR